MALTVQRRPTSKARAVRDAGPRTATSSPSGQPRFLRAPSEASEQTPEAEAESEAQSEASLPLFLRSTAGEEVLEGPEGEAPEVASAEPTSTAARSFGGEDTEDSGAAGDAGDAGNAEQGADDAAGDAPADTGGDNSVADGAGSAAGGGGVGAGGASGGVGGVSAGGAGAAAGGGGGALQSKLSAAGTASAGAEPGLIQNKCSACGAPSASPGRSPVQNKCSACGAPSAGPEPSLVQNKCSACGAEGTAARSPVQNKCSACGAGSAEPERPSVQNKCSAPSDANAAPARSQLQHKCSSCDAEGSAPASRVQMEAAPLSPGLSGAPLGTVQMWDCTDKQKPTCTRERTPISTIVQTKCSTCDEKAPLQHESRERVGDGERRPARVHREAQRGLRGAQQQLPYLARIQAAFGRHDVTSVRANIGGEARTAANNMGSLAFTSGDRIAFREQPSLHLTAHEAAHAIQQRAGITLRDGIGTAGDMWERHADRVADAVVAGSSAEPILDEVAGAEAGLATPRSRAPLPELPAANDTLAPVTEASENAATPEPASDASDSAASGANVQQEAITSGATPQIEPPAAKVPQPAPLPAAGGAGAEGGGEGGGEAGGGGGGAAGGAGGGAGGGAAAAPPTAQQLCAESQGEPEQDPAPAAANAATPPGPDVGSVGANDCYEEDIPDEPEDDPEPQSDAPPVKTEERNEVNFPAWEAPDDVCECEAVERARAAEGPGQGAAAGAAAGAAGGAGGGGANPCAPGGGAGAGAGGGAGGGGAPAAAGGQAEAGGGGAAGAALAGAAGGAAGGAAAAAGGGGGGGGGGAAAEGEAADPEAAKRESARDTAVEKYGESASKLSRRTFAARKLPNGLKFANAKRGSAAEEVQKAAALGQLRGLASRASKRMFEAITFGQKEIPSRLGKKADGAKSDIDASIAEKKQAITDRIDAARTKAEGQAGGARAHVVSTHLTSVATAVSKTGEAIKKLTEEHGTSSKAISESRENGLSGLNGLFSAYRILHNLAGETAADGAVAEGNRRAGVYETCKKGYGDDGLLTGCLTVRRAFAQQNAACKTAQATAKNMVTTAMRQGFGLRAIRTQFRCALISGASQAQRGVDQLNTQLTTALMTSLASTLTALDATRDAKLHEIEAALASQQQKLNDQEFTQHKAVNESGYIQQVAVEEQAHAGAEGMVSGINAALETTAKTVTEFIEKLTAGEPPAKEELTKAVKSGDAGLSSGLGKLMGRMTEGVGASEESLAEAATGAAKALGGIADNNEKETSDLEGSFTETMASTQAAATRELGSIRDTQVGRAAESQAMGVCGMKAAATGFQAAVGGILGKALEALVKSLNDLTQKKLADQQNELTDKITRSAWMAADKEQPAWVDVVAILLIIVVIALSIVATVLTAGAFSGFAALIIGALVGAVVGAISAGLITVLSNWRAGERNVFKGVGRAMAIGAAGGFIGGLAGGVGGLAAAAAARGVASVAARVAINIAVNMAADLAAEAATQAFAYFVFGQEFNLSGFITAAITSGISSARGPVPSGARIRPGTPHAPHVSAPRPSARDTLRGLRPRGSDLAIGAGGMLAAEGGAYLEALATGREYSFDATRAASNIAGMTGGSAAARHSGASEAGARPRGTGEEGGGVTPRPTGETGEGVTPRPTAGDEPGVAGPRPTEAGGGTTPRPQGAGDEGGAGAPRPGDATTTPRPEGGDARPRTPGADGTTPRPTEAGTPGPRPTESADASAPRRGADTETSPTGGEVGKARANDADADLVTPGASRRVEVGDGPSHTVAAKRTSTGDAVITICSACSRMSSRLNEMAGALPEGSPARGRLADLEAEVRALEGRITRGEIADVDVPEAVAALAGRLQQAASEFPSTVGHSLSEPIFNADVVRAREAARLENPTGFTRVEASLGEPIPPLPPRLQGDYTVDVNGRISRTPPKEGKVQLTNVDGHIEVHSGRTRPEPSVESEYIRTGLSEVETIELNNLRNKPRPERTDVEVARLEALRNKSQAVDLNAETGASLHGGDRRPLTADERTELTTLRDNDTRTPEQNQRLRDLEGRTRRAEVDEALAVRNDPTKSQGERNKATERLGELGADEFVAQRFPDSTKIYEGGGAGTLDGVYRSPGPPPRLIVAEAKGGSATNTSSRRTDSGERVQQGHSDYVESILNHPDSRNPNSPRFIEPGLRRELVRSLARGELIYIEVTQKVTPSGGLGDIRAREYDTGQSTTEASRGRTAAAPAGGDADGAAGRRPGPRPGADTEGGGGAGTKPRPASDVPELRPIEPTTRPPTPDAGMPSTPRPGGRTDAPEGPEGPRPPREGGETSARAREEALTHPNNPREGLAADGATRPVKVGEDTHAVAAKQTADGETVIALCSKCRELAEQLRRVAAEESLDPQVRAEIERLATHADELQRRSNLEPSEAGHLSREALTARCNELAAEVQASVAKYPKELGALAEPDPAAPVRRGAGEGDEGGGGPRRPASEPAEARGPELTPALLQDIQGMAAVTSRGQKRPQLTEAENRALAREKFGRGRLTEVPVERRVTPRQAGAPDVASSTTIHLLGGGKTARTEPVQFLVGGRRVTVEPQEGRLPIIRDPDTGVPLPVRPTETDVRVQIGGEEFALVRLDLFESDRIILFRVADKTAIPALAQNVFTVPGPIWTPASSVGFVAGAVASGKRVLLATPITATSLGGSGGPAIIAREIQFALEHGYTIRGPRPEETLGYPGARGAPRIAEFVLDPPTLRPTAFSLDPRVARLFDNTASWDALPLTLAQMVAEFGSNPPRSRGGRGGGGGGDGGGGGGGGVTPGPLKNRSGDLERASDARRSQYHAGSGAEPPARGRGPTPGNEPSLRPPETGGSEPVRQGASGEPTEGPKGPRAAEESGDTPAVKPRDEAVLRPDDPNADLAADGASRSVKVGEETHEVAAKTTTDGDTVITLCSKCRELATRLREVADGLPEGHPARSLADDLARRADALQQRANLPPGDPLHLTAEALTARCRELATEVEGAVARFPDDLTRLARSESDPETPGEVHGDFSRFVHVSELPNLPRAAPGTDTVVLGPFSRRSTFELPGGRQVVGHENTLETRLHPAARQLGGRTLEQMPGNIEALAPAIQNADRIVFFVTRGALGALTQREMDLVQASAALRAKTIFVVGAIE